MTSTILPTSARGAALNAGENQLVFVSAEGGEQGGVWTVPVYSCTATATGAPHRLTLGTGDGLRVAVANAGVIAMARTDVSVNVWSLAPSGARSAFAAAPLRRTTFALGLPTVAHAPLASASEGWRGRRETNPAASGVTGRRLFNFMCLFLLQFLS